jgi:hypothetical protein
MRMLFSRNFHRPDTLKPDMVESEHNAWTICHDVPTGVTTVRRIENEVVRRYEGHGIQTGAWRKSNYSIKAGLSLKHAG